MLRSLDSAISGMQVNQTQLDVIGNNIANVGTTAFKGGRVTFSDMLSQTSTDALAPSTNQGGINAKQVGLGVQVSSIDTLVSQGNMQPTSRNLDVAIDGSGYIMVAKGTTSFDDAKTVTVGDDPTTSTNHAITSTAGMSTMFTRDGSLTLDSQGNLLTSDGSRVLGYSLTDPAVTGVESIQSADSTVAPVVPAPTDGTAGGDIHFVDANAAITTVKSTGATTTDNVLKTLRIPDQVYEDATTSSTGTAGYVKVKSFSIDKTGLITAVLDDDKVTAIGQIAVASFKNPEGLTSLGNNIYQQSSNSGPAVVRTGVGEATTNDNSGGYGDMLQGMLEMSNVDLTQQFTDMITASRAFQASSKVISTGDEILQTVLGLIR